MKQSTPISEVLSPTSLQKGLLFHALASDDLHSDPYIIHLWGNLEGPIDASMLEHAWKELIERHVTLRSAFVVRSQTEARQIILKEIPFSLNYLDWTSLNSESHDVLLKEIREKDRRIAFDPAKPPLLRFYLAEISYQKWAFLLSHHHLILDGWSQSILISELTTILNALIEKKEARLSQAVGPHFTQRNSQNSIDTPFWKELLENWRPINLEQLRSAKEISPDSSVRLRHHLGSNVSQALVGFAQNHGITPNAIAIFAWACTLAKWTGVNDICFGLTIAGRNSSPEALNAVGMFVNTLPFRVELIGSGTVNDTLQKIHQISLQINSRDLDDLQDIQKLVGANQGSPLFSSLLAFENYPTLENANSKLQFSNIHSDERTNLPIALVIVPGLNWSVSLQINTALVDEDYAKAMASDFMEFCRIIPANGLKKLGQILDTVSNPHTKSQLIPSFYGHDNGNLISCWRKSVKNFQDNIALSYKDVHLSYRELENKSNQIARGLQKRGIKAGDHVAINLPRSPEFLISMLGILKNGAVYIPLDISNPLERLEHIIKDSQPALIIGDKTLGNLPTCIYSTLLLEDDSFTNFDIPSFIDLPAYTIYTSGSTGIPKGVQVTHHNVLSLFSACQALFNFTPDDSWSLFHSFAFDFSVWEIWGPWLSGGRCVLIPQDVIGDSAAFVKICANEKVSILSQTPSAFNIFMEAEQQNAQHLSSLRHVIFGGEALQLNALAPWFKRYSDNEPILTNMYGITETTVHTTWRRISKFDLFQNHGSLIGIPLEHLSLNLMGSNNLSTSPGIAGEIYVGGLGVANGYLNNPRLTAEKFIPDPNSSLPGKRVYRSGDLAKLGLASELEYIGRIDNQIKIRGYRIEVGEIESALSKISRIQQAKVGIWEKSDSTDAKKEFGICAWLTSDIALDPIAIRDELALRLPSYMIPDLFIPVTEFPLNINGKIDIKALPNPNEYLLSGRSSSKTDFVSEDERKMCLVWAEALKIPHVSPTENYFSIGGDSIQSIRIVALAAKVGLDFPIRQIFQNPSPRQLTQWINANSKETQVKELPYRTFSMLSNEDLTALQGKYEDAWPISKMQAGMLFHSNYGDKKNLYIDSCNFWLEVPIRQELLSVALKQIFSRHAVLRSFFNLELTVPLQIVNYQVEPDLTITDYRDLDIDLANQKTKLDLKNFSKDPLPYDLSPLIKFKLHLVSEKLSVVSFIVHHAILDGWSVANFSAEIFNTYQALLEGRPLNRSAEINTQALLSKNEALILQDLNARNRWAKRLENLTDSNILHWPLDDYLPAGKMEVPINKADALDLKDLAKKSAIPMKYWVMGCIAHLLGAIKSTPKASFGLVVNNRPTVEGSENSLGLFLNTIPIEFNAKGSWLELARHCLEMEAEIFDDRIMPLAELVKMNGGDKPFNLNFNYVNFRPVNGILDRAGIKERFSETVENSDIPLTINFAFDDSNSSISINIAHDDSWSKTQLMWFKSQLSRSLHSAIQSPSDQAILIESSLQESDQSRPNKFEFISTLTQILENLQNRKDKVALVDDSTSLNCGQLLNLSLSIAKTLEQLGTKQGNPIAILLNRSAAQVACQIGIWCNGCWFTNLDPASPLDRQVKILEDLGNPVLIGDQTTLLNFKEYSGLKININSVVVDEFNLQSFSKIITLIKRYPRNLPAYAIYTSGSTGKPKGVLITHLSLSAHMQWMTRRFSFSPTDKILNRTKSAFDASIWEIWGPLMSGAQLILMDDSASNSPEDIAIAIQKHEITILQIVPSLLDALLNQETISSIRGLRILFIGGEILRPELIAELNPPKTLTVVNLYGPSETTIDATYEIIQAKDDTNPNISIPIGQAIDGTDIFVVDKNLNLVPTGSVGELLIGGLSPGLGYINQARLTAERFIPNPFKPNSIVFRSGDLVQQLPNHKIYFIGRLDRQVKVGGNRIELDEIEAAAAKILPHTRVAVELIGHEDYSRLAIFVEDSNSHPPLGLDQLRSKLNKSLPHYMLPNDLFLVEKWPLLTSSGKTNRKALSLLAKSKSIKTLDTLGSAEQSTVINSHNEKETTLLGLAFALLGKKITPSDDFFAVGGDSIIAMQLVAKARKKGITVSPKDIFEFRTIARLAENLKSIEPQKPNEEPIKWGTYSLLPSQNWFIHQKFSNPNWWNQVVALRINEPLPIKSLLANLTFLGQQHRAFSTRILDSNVLTDGDSDPLVKIIYSKDLNDENNSLYIHELKIIQEQFSLKNGPIWGALIEVDADDCATKIFLAIHHFIIDGVSWRILFDELINLDPKIIPSGHTQSVAGISSALAKRIPTISLDSYWNKYHDEYQHTFNKIKASSNTFDSSTIHLSLNQSDTEKLLHSSKVKWQLNVEQLFSLIAVNAISRFYPRESFAISLERHGRDLYPEQSIDTVIGWFTTIYCFIFPMDGNLEKFLSTIKVKFQEIDELKIDWLTASMVRPELLNCQPHILINWLGSFDSSFRNQSNLTPLKLDIGHQIDPCNKRTNLFDITGLIENNELQITVNADPLFFDAHSLDNLKLDILSTIARISEVNIAKPERLWKLSDFPWLPQDNENTLIEILHSKPNSENIFPSSPTQQGIFFTNLNTNSAAGRYVQQIEFNISGALDSQEIVNLFNKLLDTHETLRTSFIEDSQGTIFQVVEDCKEMPHQVIDLKCKPNAANQWEDFLILDRTKGFNLAQAPLSRITIAQFSDTDWKILWSHHHLILDGWSLSILIGQLSEMLNGIRKISHEINRAPLWNYLKEQQSQESINKKILFWKSRFHEFRSPTIVSNHLSKYYSAHNSKIAVTKINSENSETLKNFAQSNGLTLSTLIQGVWSIVLSRITGQNDVVHGIALSGRPPELLNSDQWVGMFINTLPLRVICNPWFPLLDWLTDLQHQIISLSSCSQDSLADIQAWSGFSGNLFDSIVVIENYPLSQQTVNLDSKIKIHSIRSIEENEYPLSLYVEISDVITLTLRINPSIISLELAQEILKVISETLSNWAAFPQQKLGHFANTKISSSAQDISHCCGEASDITESVIQKIIKQANLHSTKIAIQDELGASYTYGEMLNAAYSVSKMLEALEIKPGDNVAVMGDHSCTTLIGFLACQLLGACFIPLDPNLPLNRLQLTLLDSESQLIIYEKKYSNHPLLKVLPHFDIQDAMTAVSNIDYEKIILPSLPMSSLAYMMFTSGSTGKPKGVQISAAAFANALVSFSTDPGVYEKDIFASVTTISFDISLAELFTPLMVGASVYLIDRDTARDGLALDRLIQKINPSIMQATPATWKLLRSVNANHPQLQVWSGGEALSPDLAQWLLLHFKSVTNFYGPTETTIWSTHKMITSPHITVGSPIQNTDIFILDSFGLPVLPTCIGELAIGGKGLARAYAQRPDLTSQAFTPHPILTGDRIYHTGDQAYWVGQRDIAVLGRIDRQLKIDGFRIELGEIEASLRQLPFVKDVVAATKAINNSPILFCWVVIQPGKDISEVNLLSHLKGLLPYYMIPKNIFFIEELPLTLNGKVNIEALNISTTYKKNKKSSPNNPLEKTVLMVWVNVLKNIDIGVEDDFIELGGHSLLATQIRARLEKIFKIEIPIALIFNARTIREFSKGLLSLTGHEVNIMDTAIQFIDLANKAVGSRNAPLKDKEPNGTS